MRWELLLETPAQFVLPGHLLCDLPRASAHVLEPFICSAFEAGNVAGQTVVMLGAMLWQRWVETSHVSIREDSLRVAVEPGLEGDSHPGDKGIGEHSTCAKTWG